jgi:hypothetical protein
MQILDMRVGMATAYKNLALRDVGAADKIKSKFLFSYNT